MNKVFRVIWNHATQTWVAVSELAKAKGKTKSKASKLTAFSVALGSTLAAGSVMAATSATLTGTISPSSNGIVHLGNGKTEVHATTDSSVSAPKNIIVIGDKDVNVFDQQIYIGFNSRNGQANGKAGDTIIGNRVDFGGGANGQDSFSTAVGFGTQVAGPSVAIGVGARSDPLDSSGWNATTNGGVAIGAFALQGGNINGGTVIGALSSGDYHYATSIGALSGITNTFVDKATNKGYTLQEGGGATNIRVAQASVGYKAGARGARSVAIANCATTGVAHTTAGTGAVAIGDQSKAFKDASIAIGQQAIAGGVTSAEITALNAEVTRIQGLLDNANATLATAVTNMNADQSADNKFNVAAARTAVQRISLALERAKKDLTYASANNSQTTAAVAIGYLAKSNNSYSTAVGPQSIANSADSTALGRSAAVSGANASSALAIGHDARVEGDKAVNAIAIGKQSRIYHNATGAIAFGSNSNIYGDSSNSIAIGTNAKISDNSRRIHGVYAVVENATVLGSFSTASANKGTAVGSNNTVIGASSGALGSDNTVGAYSSGIDTSTYNGTRSFVVGSNNTVTLANDTMVFGNNVAVTQANRSGSVILGNDSSVPENVTAINSAKVGNVTYAGFAGNLGGKTTDGTSVVATDQGRFVSIGNSTSPRQLKHVAAGRIANDSTDAINGSQLYSLTGVVSNMGVSVANVIGGNAVLNPNGTVSGFSQPLKTTGLADATATFTAPAAATNVATAITNLNDYVNAGWKIAEGDDADAKARISPNEQVNFKAAGLATVSVAANGTGANVTYTVTKGEFKDDTTDGTISAKTDKGDKAATVNDVSNAINRAYWKATAAGNGVTGTDTPDNIKAGETVTLKAGKNLTVDHKTPKTFTFATVDTPNFKGVELVDKNATDDKKLTLTPTDAGDLELNKGLSNAAAKITNVVSGLAKFDVNNPLVGNGHTLEELTMSQDDAYSGLTNLADKNVQDNTAATVGDLRGMGWVVSSNKTTGSLSNEYTSQVKNANEVKFVGTGAAVVSGKTDDNTRTITVDVAKGELVNATTDAQTGNTVNANRGKVTVKSGDDNKVATVKNVADAINSAATIIKAVNEHDTAITDTDETKNDDGEVVKAGDDVTYKAGKNLRVKRDTRNLTFALANDITVNNANVDTKLTIGKTNPVGITSDTNGLNFATTEGTNTNAPVYLNGVKSTLQDTIVAAATPNLEKVDKDVTTFTAAEKARAASVQDVLNSGWNIRGKKQATDADVANVDFVRTYDTVDFISGDAKTTEVTVNAKDDNKRTEVSIKAKTGETDVVTAADAGKKVGQVKAKANAGTTTDQGSNLATVNAVANAVNSAYWTAKAAGNGVTNDTPDQVTAGTEVTFKAGKNLAVEHTTNTFEFKTKDDVEFTSVQIGGTDGPKLTKGDGNTLKVSAADGTAPVKITNVAAGENDNDAVSYKQFKEIKAATDNTIKLTAIDNVKGTQNKTETTTSDQKLNQADGINFKLASADNDLLSVKAAGDTVTFTPKLGKVEITDGKAVEATSQTGLVEATELTEALNKLGWKTKATEAGSTANPVDQEINAGDSVNYEDGQGTTAKVEITKGATNPDTGISTPDTVSVKYDVKAADNTINVSDAGVKVNTGSIELAKTDEKANDRGKVTITPKAKVDGGTETQEEANKRAETEVATVKNVADAINSAATIIKAHNDNTEITDEVKDDKGETVKAGDEVTYTAGKNLRVKRDARNLTFALANEIEVEKATVTKSLTIGEDDNTTILTSDEDGLSVAGKNNAPRKVTNVAEGTETLVFDKEGNQLVEIGGKFYDTADIDGQGLPKADAKEKTPLKDTDTDADAYAKAASGLADLAGSDQTNALTVADAGKLGWVMSAGGNSTAVQNADEVIFNAKDGVNITSHFDANSGKYNVDFGLKVDEDADNILNVTEDGVSVLKGELEAAATTGTTRGKVTVKEADQTGDNQVATVNNVAEAINSAKWFAKAENLEEALTDRAQKDTDEEAAAIGAGDLIALKADKNLAVKREGTNFTYGLAKDIGVNSITLGTAETAVNLSSSAGALNVADKDGNTAQITNVKAGAEVVTFDKDGNQIVKKGDKYVTLDDAGNPTNIEATPATEEELAKLDPSQKALAGLADLYGSKGTNALTVEDARNLGWVVSAGDHSAAVTNTDEVVFEGTNGVDVSAKSENGVHTITVGIAQGKVDGNTTTGVATGDTNYVTGDQVAKAINESGWKTNVTQTNATTG
ncbi:ESPR-type extended signal peptide-containing protein, partial [Haemophilus parahaemolyticus]|uniref:ESPR-type extended signal peptide-containing protein n=1 Tax=Haemophilus parahaemolyticus TaxID=735 RepID=UPI002910C171